MLARLATCAADSLLTFFRTSLGLDDGVCGAVLTIQTTTGMNIPSSHAPKKRRRPFPVHPVDIPS